MFDEGFSTSSRSTNWSGFSRRFTAA